MTSSSDVETRLASLEKEYADLLERVRSLELQTAQLTQRNLQGSCSSCTLGGNQ